MTKTIHFALSNFNMYTHYPTKRSKVFNLAFQKTNLVNKAKVSDLQVFHQNLFKSLHRCLYFEGFKGIKSRACINTITPLDLFYLSSSLTFYPISSSLTHYQTTKC